MGSATAIYRPAMDRTGQALVCHSSFDFLLLFLSMGTILPETLVVGVLGKPRL